MLSNVAQGDDACVWSCANCSPRAGAGAGAGGRNLNYVNPVYEDGAAMRAQGLPSYDDVANTRRPAQQPRPTHPEPAYQDLAPPPEYSENLGSEEQSYMTVEPLLANGVDDSEYMTVEPLTSGVEGSAYMTVEPAVSSMSETPDVSFSGSEVAGQPISELGEPSASSTLDTSTPEQSTNPFLS